MMLWWIYKNGYAEDMRFFVAENDEELLEKFNATRRGQLGWDDVLYGGIEEVEGYIVEVKRIEA